MKNTTLYASIVALAFASSAEALVVDFDTDTYAGGTTIPLTQANWDTNTPPPSPLLLPEWNTGLVAPPPPGFNWVLIGITVDVRSNASFSYGVENFSQTAGTVASSVDLTVDVDFTLPCSACSTGLGLAATFGIPALPTFDGNVDFAGASGITQTDSDTDSQSLVIGAANWGFYTGAGDFSIRVTAVGDKVGVVSGGNPLENTQWNAGAGAHIQYEYEARPTGIPAPATLALMGLGLVGFGAARRRRG